MDGWRDGRDGRSEHRVADGSGGMTSSTGAKQVNWRAGERRAEQEARRVAVTELRDTHRDDGRAVRRPLNIANL